jgi:hypothetical protein
MRYFSFLSIGIFFFIFSCSTKNEQTNSSVAVDSLIVSDDKTMNQDWLLVPGERAGLIMATSSEAELVQLLGEENVHVRDTIFLPEGDFMIGTILYKNTPNEVQIIWKDTLAFANPDWVSVGSWEADKIDISRTNWKTMHGVTLGTTLQELEKINGRPFFFYGFGWDLGGGASGWNGGKLTGKDGLAYFNVQLSYDFMDDKIQAIADQLMGDNEFLSNTEAAQKLNPYVSMMSIRFHD